MKTRFFGGADRGSLDSMMTPMIDVVFLLLVFFLTTSSFQRLEQLLPGAVSAESESKPGGESDEPPQPSDSDLSDCIVKIAQDGSDVRYRFNDQPLASMQALSDQLKRVITLRPDIPIIVDPEDTILARYAIEVYDAAKAHGGLAVYLVAR